MENININKTLLKEIIKESFFEVIREERLNFYEQIIPNINNKEMKEIEEKYISPKKYINEDFIDMTEWVKS